MARETQRSSAASWVSVAVVFEFSLAGLAAVLGWIFGVNPFRDLVWHEPAELVTHVLYGGLAVVPLLVAFVWLRGSRWAVFRELRRLIHEQLLPHFARASPLELAWLSLAAGVGEELLFRGFLISALQSQLDPQAVGGWLPLIVSSVLFGLAHSVSWTYLGMAMAVGFYFGGLLLATGSLWVPVTTHALYDFMALCWLRRDHREKNRAT